MEKLSLQDIVFAHFIAQYASCVITSKRKEKHRFTEQYNSYCELLHQEEQRLGVYEKLIEESNCDYMLPGLRAKAMLKAMDYLTKECNNNGRK